MVPATVARRCPIGLGLHRVIWIDLPRPRVFQHGHSWRLLSFALSVMHSHTLIGQGRRGQGRQWEPIGTADPDQAELSDADDLLGGLGAQVGQLATLSGWPTRPPQG
jgi:hypothetical protein